MSNIADLIESVNVDSHDNVITFLFKQQTNEYFLNNYIEDNELRIRFNERDEQRENFHLDWFNDGEVTNCTINLVFEKIEVIRLLTSLKRRFLDDIISINSVYFSYWYNDTDFRVHLQTNEIALRNRINLKFKDLLLINCEQRTIGTINEIKPIGQVDILKNDMKLNLYRQMYNTERFVIIHYETVVCINCYVEENEKIHLIIRGSIPDKIYSYLPINTKPFVVKVSDEPESRVYISSINKPPISNITGLPIPINTSGTNASSIDLSEVKFAN